MRGPFVAALALTLGGCLISPETPDCDFSETCDACLARSGCGWCPGFGCVPGTSLGPSSIGSCVDYRWDDCTVPVDPCAQYRDCDTCRLATSCEWCDSTRGACSLRGESCTFGVVASCEAPPRTCAVYSSCGSCLADSACEWDGTSFLHCDDCGGASLGVCQNRLFCL